MRSRIRLFSSKILISHRAEKLHFYSLSTNLTSLRIRFHETKTDLQFQGDKQVHLTTNSSNRRVPNSFLLLHLTSRHSKSNPLQTLNPAISFFSLKLNLMTCERKLPQQPTNNNNYSNNHNNRGQNLRRNLFQFRIRANQERKALWACSNPKLFRFLNHN